MTANERQVGGDHYKTGGEEHWDRVNRLGLDYFQGQITKYVERWKKKNGVQDLEKARHFLDKYIELEEARVRHEMQLMEDQRKQLIEEMHEGFERAKKEPATEAGPAYVKQDGAI